jgi:membrane fusion protein (multidrug efflux system)
LNLFCRRAVLLTLFVSSLSACRGSDAAPVAQTDDPTPTAVKVAPVAGQDEPVTLEATGSFVADELSDVAPEASGRVVETPVDVGQYVRAGQPLVRIQGVGAGLRLDEAKAAMARAESNVKLAESQNALARTTSARYLALLATGDVSKTLADQATTQAETSQQQLVTARASLAESQAQFAQAEKAVSDVIVSAPFDGSISARNVSVGEYVQPSTPVVTLVKVNPLRLQLSIPGVQAAQVARGQAVTTSVDAYPGERFTGKITAINPVISPESRSFVAEVSVPNPQAKLRPGMFAVATIDQGKTARTLLVPKSAVVEDVNTNSWRVFVVDKENRARLRVVQLAARQSGDRVRLLAGVAEGERVVSTNAESLYDTAPVTVTP